MNTYATLQTSREYRSHDLTDCLFDIMNQLLQYQPVDPTADPSIWADSSRRLESPLDTDLANLLGECAVCASRAHGMTKERAGIVIKRWNSLGRPHIAYVFADVADSRVWLFGWADPQGAPR